MGGLFDDIFGDEDFEIKDEEEVEVEESVEEDWSSGLWDTGQQQDLWDCDEPWVCEEEVNMLGKDDEDVFDNWI